ncbi:ABC-2 type transport system permease protein [Actinopolyspora alba]|uniref:ABC-2 type transport system permease protein n=1 Tax=Actinopolyspora alba TaxID=673379 RepID=A0A1I1ZBJ4_9ACTN|nr:ABC transporter permease [Actinopolyspora alba]SFE28942.1 ABC-2 type transport system permease protein [Actinopolyspora alba]
MSTPLRTPRTAIPALLRAELNLLLRNRTVAVTATLLPVLLGLLLTRTSGPSTAVPALATQILTILGFTVYLTVTTTLTSRRQEHYLKRLCCAAPSPVTVLNSLVLVPALLAVAQLAVVLAIGLRLLAPLRVDPLFLLLAVLAGTVCCAVVGVATTGFTSSAEHVQITTLPFLLLLLGGGAGSAVAGQAAEPLRFTPGGAVTDLVRRAVAPGEGVFTATLTALAVLAAWTLLALLVARRTFRWEPRS